MTILSYLLNLYSWYGTKVNSLSAGIQHPMWFSCNGFLSKMIYFLSVWIAIFTWNGHIFIDDTDENLI